jgi:hypothetical protein
MIDNKKIKKLQEYFARKREIESNQLTNIRGHKVAVASLQQVQERVELTEAADLAIKKKSQKSGINVKTLQEIYRRGVFAWTEESNITAQQMGFARINSFISRGQSFYSDDRDLAIKLCLDEQLNKKTLNAQELAKHHNLPIEKINAEIAKGEKVEMEHTKDKQTANQIARDHIKEDPKYYEKLSKIEKKPVAEDLRKWFNPNHPEGGWKRVNSKGEVIGPCAREPGEAKPKCMSNKKRAQLTKKQRAAAVAAKRKHDPNPERKGKPINVSNFGKGKLSK